MKTIQEGFNGFTANALNFFNDLSLNNNREWFLENKKTYEKEIKIPSHALVAEMASIYAENNLPYLADPKKSLFRINRDIRFSNNKDPYKTNLGVFFPFVSNSLIGKPVENPGIYFHFDNKETFIAGGLHMPDSNQLKGLRSKIAEDYQEFEEIINDSNFKKEFPSIFVNEGLKRIPQGYSQEHPAAKYLKLKEFTVYAETNRNDSYSRDLLEILLNKSIVIRPLLEFFCESVAK